MSRANRNRMIGGGVIALAALGLLLPLDDLLPQRLAPDPPRNPSAQDAATGLMPGDIHAKQPVVPPADPSARATPEAVPGDTSWDLEQAVDAAIAGLEPIFPDTPLGRDLQAHIDALEAMGPDAATHYQETLEALRAHPADATALLEDSYRRLPEARYLDRWKLVDTLGALENAAALGSLAEIAAAAIPQERSSTGAELSPYSEETMIRAAAIDGIRRLAESGVAGAQRALIDVVASADESARLAAVVAYRSLDPGHAVDLTALEAALSPTDQWMLEIEVAGAPPATAYTQVIDAEASATPRKPEGADDPDGRDDLPPRGEP